MFSFFKQYYTHFYILFHLYVFLKKIEKLLFKRTYQTGPKIWKSKIVEIKIKLKKQKNRCTIREKENFLFKEKKGRTAWSRGRVQNSNYFFLVTDLKSLAYICLLSFGIGWVNGFNPILSGLRVLEKENQNLKDPFWISLHLIKKKRKTKSTSLKVKKITVPLPTTYSDSFCGLVATKVKP